MNTYSSDFEYNITGKILRKNQENKGLIEDTGETVTIGETTYDWNYEYGGAQPNAVTKAGTRTFSYDLNGNMTAMGPLTPTGGTGAGVTRTLLWDEENRLKKTTDASGSNSIVTTYGYGADGMRAIKKGKYGTVQYVSENYVVRNKDLISKHVFAGNTRLVSNMVMREEKSGKMVSTEQGCYYYHADHLGSSSVVTDKDGKFYEQLEYFPYGETWVHNKAITEQESTPYKFTSKELDPETGLYYFGARYYDGKLSRWTAADPPLARGDYLPVPAISDEAKDHNDKLPGMGGVFNTINLDGYQYAGQNPVMLIDPDGNADVLSLAVDVHQFASEASSVSWASAKSEWSQGNSFTAAWYTYCAGANGAVSLVTPSNYKEAGEMAFMLPLFLGAKVAGLTEKQLFNNIFKGLKFGANDLAYSKESIKLTAKLIEKYQTAAGRKEINSMLNKLEKSDSGKKLIKEAHGVIGKMIDGAKNNSSASYLKSLQEITAERAIRP